MTRSGNTRNGKYMGEDKRRYHTITNILQYNLIPDFFTIFAKYCITFKNMTIEKTFAQISELFDQFSKDASLQVEKGNKAAGTRARKASLELEKLLKRFRKESLEASK